MSFLDTLKILAPTVASALGGPLAGAAVSAIGGMFGIPEATQDKIETMFTDGKMTPDQISALRTLELQYQNDEQERGFKYTELEFKDRDSARTMAEQTHSLTPSLLTWVVVAVVMLAEGGMLFKSIPSVVDPVVLGRIMGTMDSALIMVLSFWFGSNSGSARKTELLAAAQPPTSP